VGDLVHDPIADRRAILTDVRSDGTYLLRARFGPDQWFAEEPARLRVVTRRAERDDW
jgi:hypothetical protein